MRNEILRHVIVATLALTGTLVGQHLVRDIDSRMDDPGSDPSRGVVMPAGGPRAGLILFAATDLDHGRELWISDRTEVGTALVLDINPGAGDSSPTAFVAMGSRVYFTADDGTQGAELWSTDGTPGGTQLVRDIWTGSSSSEPLYLTVAGGTLFFSARIGSSRSSGRELWKSDGTSAGTVLVRDIYPGANWITGPYSSNPSEITAFSGGGVMFQAEGSSTQGVELWYSDGTSSGTILLRDINTGSGDSMPAGFLSWNQSITSRWMLFSADDGTHGRELWKSDGTPAGTVLVSDIAPGAASSEPSTMVVLPVGGTTSMACFSADDGTHGREPWTTQGTTSTTRMILDIRPGALSSVMSDLTMFGGRPHFLANDGVHGLEMWKSGGTGPSTVLAFEIVTGPPGWFAFHWMEPTAAGLLLSATPYTLVGGLFVYDGTRVQSIASAGTTNNWIEDYIVIDGSGVLYRFAPGARNAEPWWCAFSGGAGLVKNIYPPVPLGSAPHEFCTVGSRTFFAASDADGEELWVTDGTSAGTRQVLDLNPGPDSSSPREMTPLGDDVVFVASEPGRPALWISDGTTAGTTRIAAISFATEMKDLTLWNGLILFCTDSNLWRTDGTSAGTSQLGAAARAPSQLIVFRDHVYFTAESTSYGRELWRTDGTVSGTSQVLDLATGATDGLAADASMAVMGSYLYFAGSTSGTGTELFRTDGTASGTALVQDIVPGATGADPRRLIAFRSNPASPSPNVLVFQADDGVHGVEYWRSDGSIGSASLMYDIGPGAMSGVSPVAPAMASDRAGRLYFPADDGVHGIEPWRTNGSASGTALVRDIRSGSSSSMSWSATLPLFLPGSDRRVLVAADDGTHGEELFLCAVGAGTIFDLNPGSASAGITEIGRLRDTLLFGGDDGVHGVELFALPLGDTRATLVELAGGGCGGNQGVPGIDTFPGQLPSIGNGSFGMQTWSAPPGRAATLFIGLGIGDLPLGPCNFRAFPELFNIPTSTSPSGLASVPIPMPGDPSLVGWSITFQWIVLDPTGALFGLASLSDAMFAVIGA